MTTVSSSSLPRTETELALIEEQERIRELMRAELLERSIKTLALRVAQQNANAAYLAEGPRGPVVVKTTRRSEPALAWTAEAMARAGGVGVVHKNMPPKAQATHVADRGMVGQRTQPFQQIGDDDRGQQREQHPAEEEDRPGQRQDAGDGQGIGTIQLARIRDLRPGGRPERQLSAR